MRNRRANARWEVNSDRAFTCIHHVFSGTCALMNTNCRSNPNTSSSWLTSRYEVTQCCANIFFRNLPQPGKYAIPLSNTKSISIQSANFRQTRLSISLLPAFTCPPASVTNPSLRISAQEPSPHHPSTHNPSNNPRSIPIINLSARGPPK